MHIGGHLTRGGDEHNCTIMDMHMYTKQKYSYKLALGGGGIGLASVFCRCE
jgi:hypothetical protein